uniref:Rho guanine nucleotide exchange factor (GEF) 12a n=1 Tax=Esox lucius TaxID=8010 RepID=A0A6Q2ZKZ4_ESOLU
PILWQGHKLVRFMLDRAQIRHGFDTCHKPLQHPWFLSLSQPVYVSDVCNLLSVCVGLVQRCVIIQKDENGFGLTVSGDNPVFVQLVKEDGAAMRAGVQTGDRIIKVNGTLVTHSNHVEVVKLIKSGSYVALTVLGRPPGLPQITLSEGERCSTSTSPLDLITSPVLWAMKEEYSRNPRAKLLKDIQEAKKHIPLLQGQLSKATGTPQVYTQTLSGTVSLLSEEEGGVGAADGELSPFSRGESSSSDGPWNNNTDCNFQSSLGSPFSRLKPQIIGAEDDYFDTEQEQVNGQCSCFQSVEILKSRPAHLAAFLHHVVSQFDPAPLLCYLYADLYKQTNSKETRRIFMDFHAFFMDRAAVRHTHEHTRSCRRRPELIPEELHRQYTQLLQETLLPDIQKNLEDFRQKRSMGLTLAEGELAKLDVERVRDRVAMERERSCAEHIISKIEEVLMTSQPTEEEKCTTMQYVILTYMKHLGVKVKEPRGLEPKRVRINFLPKIKQKSKPEKEGEEKVKKPRFHGILGPPRRPSRVDSTSSKSKRLQILHAAHLMIQSVNHIYFIRPFLQQLSHNHNPDVLTRHACCSNIRMDGLGAVDVQSEDDQGNEIECEQDPPNWQTLVSQEVLAGLTPQEIKRQEVINELFYTERAHLRMLKVLDNVFYQKLTRDSILPPGDIKNIFTNLEEIVQLHEQMTAIRKKNETSVIDLIGDDLLVWFSDGEEEKIKLAVGTFCSNQPFALELIKTRQKKDQRFTSFMQEAESNRLCRRLQLKDIIPVEMQRLTKYPLLLESIAKYTEDEEERDKVKRAGECCRNILNYVNQAVKEAENKQRLEDYQRRLDLSSLKQSENPMISEFKNLDLTKRKMVHEGPLSWKVNKDKTIELYTLLLEDILVLLQKQDERLVLKCHSKNLAGTADTKHIFSPIIKLNTVLVRSVATDNKSFFVLSMSDNGAQIYELMAQTVSEQRTKSDNEEEEESPLPVVGKEEDGEEEEEEVGDIDEEEVEAFLHGELTDRLPFLKERSRQGIAIDDQEPDDTFGMPASRAEEALRTCEFTASHHSVK